MSELQGIMPERTWLLLSASRTVDLFMGMSVWDGQSAKAEEKSAPGLEDDKKGHDDAEGSMLPSEISFSHRVLLAVSIEAR